MKYNIATGVERSKHHFRKVTLGITGSLIMAGAAAFPAMAAGNSTPGIGRYDSNPGRQQATEVGAQCGSGAGSGAFGYFGRDNNLAGGADGQQTGLNNSSICGNRQGNL